MRSVCKFLEYPSADYKDGGKGKTNPANSLAERKIRKNKRGFLIL
jgi:hypothetical protein